MACSAGPDIAESGLVLALDAADYNSFKGEVTTNELVTITWSGDGTAQSGMSFGSAPVTEEHLKYKGYETYLWSPGTNLNCYLNGADVDVNRTSTVWTFSCYIKRQDGAPITSLNVYMYYPSSDGSATGTIQDVGNGWYRVSRTRTGTSSNIALAGFTGFVAGYKYYLSGAQLEKKSYPTTVVSTNTTRGSTVATGGGWADLIGNGNHGELVNGVRESSDKLGALVFDGTNDYINCGSNSSLGLGALTLSAWVKASPDVSNYRAIIADESSGGAPWNYRLYLRIGDGHVIFDVNGGGYSGVSSTYAINNNQWYHICAVRTSPGGTQNLYINGILNNSGSDATSITTVANAVWIGQSPYNNGSYPFNGNIASVKIHNRALSAQEVQQNFNMMRGRFGI